MYVTMYSSSQPTPRNEMQLTTIEQLKKVKPNDTLFLINPFGNSNQAEIKVCAFGVRQVNEQSFDGEDLNQDSPTYNHFNDMIRGCKYVYTELLEANDKLKEIQGGLHQQEVSDHHERSDLMWGKIK